jgi:hypothetical protein
MIWLSVLADKILQTSPPFFTVDTKSVPVFRPPAGKQEHHRNHENHNNSDRADNGLDGACMFLIPALAQQCFCAATAKGAGAPTVLSVARLVR